jgi:hypothetical protein
LQNSGIFFLQDLLPGTAEEIPVLRELVSGLVPQDILQGKIPAILPGRVILQEMPREMVHPVAGKWVSEQEPEGAGRLRAQTARSAVQERILSVRLKGPDQFQEKQPEVRSQVLVSRVVWILAAEDSWALQDQQAGVPVIVPFRIH